MKSDFSKSIAREIEIQQQVFRSVDQFESFIFNAGAGAGKTYSLVETLKYIIKNKGKKLQQFGQKIACVTYTNVAANEIKKRLGNSHLIEVSTIHEMLWLQIKSYKSLQLIDVHRQKIGQELKVLQTEIDEIKKQKSCFGESWIEDLLNEDARQKYYELEAQNLNAKNFKDLYCTCLPEVSSDLLMDAMSNLGNFKKFLNKNFQSSRLKMALKELNGPIKNKKIEIKYDSLTNRDRLASMRFSHDTLLEYSRVLFKDYPLLQRIMVDRYPYIFIDEYQDTHTEVIEIIDMMTSTARHFNTDWLVGYFGDHQQQIYSAGSIGQNLILRNSVDHHLKIINKEFNRRSHKQIIDLINKIRDDPNFIQLPLNPEKINGHVFFGELKYLSSYTESHDYVNDIINQFKDKYPDADSIHCLVALNKTIAELSGFLDIYKVIQDLRIIDWNNINVQFLSHDLKKLHPFLRAIYQLLNLYKLLADKRTSLADLYVKKDHITVQQACNYVQCFSSINNELPLSVFIDHFFSNIETDSEVGELILRKHFSDFFINNRSLVRKRVVCFKESFLAWLKEIAYTKNIGANDSGSGDNGIEISNLINIPIKVWINWFDYISNIEAKGMPVFHTFHSTKGEEYNNVIIFLGHDFGSKQKNKFKKYFSKLPLSERMDLEENEDKEFIDTRNLLYVACSRAIQNLWVVYTDPIDDDNLKTGLEHIFGQIKSDLKYD